MTARPLPRNPNLKLINDEARNLLYDFHHGNTLAPARYSLFDSLSDTVSPRLVDAQHLIAGGSKFTYNLDRHGALLPSE